MSTPIYHGRWNISKGMITLRESIFSRFGYSGIPLGFVAYFKNIIENVFGSVENAGVPEKKCRLGADEVNIWENHIIKTYFSKIGYESSSNTIDFNYATEIARDIQENWDNNVTSLYSWFYWWNTRHNYDPIYFMPFVNTSNVTNMENCFENCTSLRAIPILDTSKVTTMSCCFSYCSNLVTIPRLNTWKVTDMSSCFEECSSLITIPYLDTSSVTNMAACFKGCTSLTTLSKLNTSNVIYMDSCFQNCENLVTIPELDTSNVTNMSYCFNCCYSLTTLPRLNTNKMTNITGCFTRCDKLTRIEELSFESMGNMSTEYSTMWGTEPNDSCRYMLIKDIGTNPSCTKLDFSFARKWGIATDEVPDARQSLIYSLLTYSFYRPFITSDRCEIMLNPDVYDLLTEDEKSQIQARGYRLTSKIS